MRKELSVKRRDLEEAKDSFDYLNVIREKYGELWEAEPEKFVENFNEDQITLIFYGILYDQVQNGGFLQLIFNGYAQVVFSEPMVDGLKSWGAGPTAELIESITAISLKVDGEIDKTSLESLSNSYSQYPEFEEYDQAFYRSDGSEDVKDYVSGHLSDFIMVE